MASLGAWPAAFVPSAFKLVLHTNQRVNAAPGGGSEQVVDMLNDRWTATLSLPMYDASDAAALEAFVAGLRGQVNTVDLCHLRRKVPQGTMRGSPTLYAGALQGASSIQIQGSAGDTLKAGDMLGIGGLLLMVSADASANGFGVLAVSIANRLRIALTLGSSVTWNAPTAPFRVLTTSGVEYVPGTANQVDFTLGEKI